MSMFLFNSDGVEICYGPHLGEDFVYVSSDDEYEGNLNRLMFTAQMNTCDWKYKLNIPLSFAKDNLGTEPKEVDLQCPASGTNFKVKYVPRLDNKGCLYKDKFEKGWGNSLAIMK
ncbi:hypothetical protein GH714_009701 [Hevea brasiliensis]|uniref:Uncharacterized protein n=1 Tax=Hevea brasiliensis TaxID=3981 RepID=A0A6A6M920_HEVBR|nr:hypothetical protein GH714_009701 [Hevea brasiliensis]